MKQEPERSFEEVVRTFHLPRYQEIPDVGLYLEQAAKYIGGFLDPLEGYSLTPSMISNYVKKGLIPSPVKKRYDRDRLAYLLFVAIGKSVLSLDALGDFMEIQKKTYALEQAYDYFCREYEKVLQFTFEIRDLMDSDGEETSPEKRLCYTCVVAAVQKIYLEKNLRQMVEKYASGEQGT